MIMDNGNNGKVLKVYQLIIIHIINNKYHFCHDNIYYTYKDAEIEALKRKSDTVDYQIVECLVHGYKGE